MDGSVMGKTNSSRFLIYMAFPVKLSVGKSEVDLNENTAVVSIGGSVSLLDIHKGVVNETNVGLEEDPSDVEEIISKIFAGGKTPAAYFIIYNDDNDTVLENFEKAYLVINLGSHGLEEYDTVKIEVRTGSGAALMVQRAIPGGLPENDYIDLG